MMKKISLFITNLTLGGAERVLVHLANELCERDYDVHVVLVQAVGDFLLELNPKIKVIDLKCSRIVKTIPKLSAYLKNEKPDALIVFIWPLTIISIWACWISGQSKKTKILLTEHCSWTMIAYQKSTFQKLMKWSMRAFYPFAHAVIAVSEGAKKDLIHFAKLNPKKIKLKAIYNPVVDSKTKVIKSLALPSSWSEGTHHKILAVGNLHKVKDHMTLIKAFKIVRHMKDAKLLILGEGELRPQLELLIHNLDLASDCILYGQSTCPEVFYQMADLFVLSSKSEGLPSVLIEALSYGLPIVSTNCPNGPAEILLNGEYGRLVPVGDIEKLAFEMMNGLDFPGEKQLLQERALFFSIPRAVDDYLHVLGE